MTTQNLNCPHCGNEYSSVNSSNTYEHLGIVKYRMRCRKCKERFSAIAPIGEPEKKELHNTNLGPTAKIVFSQDMDDLIIQLRKDKEFTSIKIAEKLGVCHSTYAKRVRELKDQGKL